MAADIWSDNTINGHIKGWNIVSIVQHQKKCLQDIKVGKVNKYKVNRCIKGISISSLHFQVKFNFYLIKIVLRFSWFWVNSFTAWKKKSNFCPFLYILVLLIVLIILVLSSYTTKQILAFVTSPVSIKTNLMRLPQAPQWWKRLALRFIYRVTGFCQRWLRVQNSTFLRC